MSILGGEYNSRDVGGIKPIIHGIDSQGNSFVIKTSFQKKLEYEQFFKDNPDVMGITFASSVKKVGADYTDSFKGRMLSAEEFNGGKIGTITDSNKKITLRPEHVSISAIKGSKKTATITIGNSNHIVDANAKRDFWNDYYRDPIAELQTKLGERNDIGRSNERIADARRILGSQFEEKSSVFDMSEGQLSVIDQWLKVGGDPSMFERQYNDAIKSYYLDPILSPKVNGGQSVLASDTKSELTNTVILDGKIWDTGEVFLSRQEAKKSANLDRIHIVERESAGYDRIYPIIENKKLKNAFIDAMEAAGKREQKYTLQDFVDFAKIYSEQAGRKHKFQVLTAVERIPHVKESSVMLVGIKDFRDASEGNIVTLNNADVKRAAEGDYDIDTANIFGNLQIA